ncbi:MAG: glycosyltransferase family protein [Candidatus Margulisiibacteriota bacterium]
MNKRLSKLYGRIKDNWILDLGDQSSSDRQKSPAFLEWLNSDLIGFVEEYVCLNKMEDSAFIKGLNRAFKTERFVLLLKRWLVEYFLALFGLIDDHLHDRSSLYLEDIKINRFAVEKYSFKFKLKPNINWGKKSTRARRMINLALYPFIIILHLFNSGIKFTGARKRFMVMRESLWGLKDVGGHYLHDDFFVDGNKLKREDLLLFSRGIPKDLGRLKGYHDAQVSDYSHFMLGALPLGIGQLGGVLRRYLLFPTRELIRAINDDNYLVCFAILRYFAKHALAYEKIFSNYNVGCELGHNYFAASHIAEAIVCQYNGARYYLFNWSDSSVKINSYICSFLGCDKYLIWGAKQIRGVEGKPALYLSTGYVFKRFINQVIADRDRVLAALGITAKGKIISLFDESFGGGVKMTADHYVAFWQMALDLANKETSNTIIMKPKVLERYYRLPEKQKMEFEKIKSQLEKLPNVYIIKSERWSFIEYIGISDVVVTQGMTSSATIAIICGLEGFYFDQAQYDHPFSRLFKDTLVFDDPDKLIKMIHDVVAGFASPLKDIPDNLLREYDEYPDDRGIEVFRDVLSNKKRIGVIVQARMGSTRLPGKVMLSVENKPVLQHIIERLKDCNCADEIIIATTNNKKDDIIVDLAKANGISYFRGSEENVLSRYYYAAKENNLDVVVRITSDCPFVDPSIIDNMILEFLKAKRCDYLSNCLQRTFPRGLDVEIFGFKALERSAKEAKQDYEKEHVTPYLYQQPRGFVLKSYNNPTDYSGYRLTLDTVEDYSLIKRIYALLYPLNNKFRLKEIIDLLKHNDDLSLINAHIKQKELCVK